MTNIECLRDANQHIWQITLNNGAWGTTDLTAASSAPLAAVGSGVSGFVTSYDQHWVFEDANQHIWQITLNNGAWGATDLTSASGAPQAAPPPPPTCADVSPAYLGTAQLNAAGTFTATATVSNASSVKFFVYNEQTQDLSSAASYSGASVPSDTLGFAQYAVTLPFSAFQQLGSYAVVATAYGSAGSASCSANHSGYFAVVVKDSDIPSNLNGKSQTGCGSLAGTWDDQAGLASGETIDKWVLTQSGNGVSGTQTVSNGPSCGSIVWQVSGQLTDAQAGKFSLTATNPSVSVDNCGYLAATNVAATVTVSGAGCSSASGNEIDTYPPGYGSATFSTTWTTTLSIPSGETSIFDQWGPGGYSSQALFKGQLTTSAGSAQFAGRTVKESATSLGDGCAQLDPDHRIEPVQAGDLHSQWTVLSDSTYTDDWIGYGPGVLRYFQTRVGTCSLTVPQQMSISSENNPWVQYKRNQITVSVTPTGVTVQRDAASQSKAYPR